MLQQQEFQNIVLVFMNDKVDTKLPTGRIANSRSLADIYKASRDVKHNNKQIIR